MDHYIDIQLLPDPEFPATLLMNALFAKLHRGLVALGSGNIGVSFPEVEDNPHGLGQKLRLHGSHSVLEQLTRLSWQQGMADHLRQQAIRPVPETRSFRTVRRVQAKSNPERLRRRLMKRKGYDEKQALAAIPDSTAERLNLPYIMLTSQSTGQKFPLFIEHGPLRDQPVSGKFSSYGLSAEATVPWF